MDNRTIIKSQVPTIVKNQISYWETMLKEGERAVKVQQEQNAIIKTTIKSLRALLPKEKEQEVPEPEQGVEEVQ